MKKLTYLMVLIACLFSFFSVSHATQEGTPSDATTNPNNTLFVESFNMCWNGSIWERCFSYHSTSVSHILTSTTTVVKATPGVLSMITVIGTGSADDKVDFYNVAGASCTGTPAIGTFVARVFLSASNVPINFNHFFSSGICAVTTGTTAGDFTVLYR